ncbi:MAG: cation:proton antiporter [Gammaproteobacteria bacterium]
MPHEETVVALSVIGLVAIFCQWFAWTVKLPAILFLLLAGIVLGPVAGWLDPDRLFGDLLFPMVSLSVAIILFEGSLTLKFREIAGLQKVVRNMLTVGIAVTWLITALAARWFLDFSWGLSWLFGAIMVVTGPTVIVPMLRTVRPNAAVANILRWEGIVIDPIGAILALLVFGFLMSGQTQAHLNAAATFLIFGETLLAGLAVGALAGQAFGLVLRHHLLPEYLHNVAALSAVFGVYALSGELLEESGLLAVTVMGVRLANMKDVSVEDILDFKESLSVLLISGLFIILAARLDFASFSELGFGAVAVFLVMQFVARPLKVFVSTWRTSLSWQEKAVIGWIGPRGIVAAAVSALFALRMQEAGVEQAALLVPLAFAVIIGTVVIQSATAKWLANRLSVSEPDDKGFLIVGANIVARSIARALNENGFRTVLSDASWENIRMARMEGLDTYYGKAVSEHADRHLDLVGLGGLLALTPQDDLNALACLRYRNEFGANRCFYLPAGKTNKNGGNHSRVNAVKRGRALFAEDATFPKLASLIGKGARIGRTRLSESFDFEDYRRQHGSRSIPLFAIGPRGHLHCFVQEKLLRPEKGWIVIALMPGPERETGDEGGGSDSTARNIQAPG